MKNLIALRLTLAVILLVHSVPGMFNNGINNFGNLYLNTIGLEPFGLVLAWAIKLSHVAAAISFLTNRYVKITGLITIVVLLVGIFLVHLPNGWFVVGGGTNGVEFNVLLIAAILSIMYPDGFKKS